MTTNDLLQQVRARLRDQTPREGLARLENEIMQASYPALERLARAVAESDEQRHLLTKTFGLVAVAGVAPLAPALTAPEPALLEHLDKASVIIADSPFPVMPCADAGWQQLEADGRCSYFVQDGTLVVKGVNGPYTGNVTVERWPFVPALPSVQPPLDGPLAELVSSMLAPPPARRQRQPTTTEKGTSQP